MRSVTTPTVPTRAGHARVALLVVLVLLLASAVSFAAPPALASAAGGPVILMGLDSEDGAGSSAHGPPEEHVAMVESLLAAVNNGGEGILVIGDGDAFRIRNYWENDIGAGVGEDVTFVAGVDDILAQSFDGFAMIGVASSASQTGGGLTDAENAALIAREIDIAAFVNGGGGLLGKTQEGMSDPYGYVGPLGEFVPRTAADGVAQYQSVEVTPAGEALGLTTAGMSGWCCWHDVFEDFPDFMDVIVTHDSGGNFQGMAAAVGGVDITIPTGIDLEPASTSLEVGEAHTVHASVEEDDGPAADVEVTFTVVDGPHAGATGTAVTGADGSASFTYDGVSVGTDRLEASFVDLLDRTRTSNQVTVEWAEASAPEPECTDLVAGQSTTVGTVCVTDDGEELSVTYTTTDGWSLVETHLDVADHADDLARNKRGNPKVGHFAQQQVHAPSLSTYTYTRPLDGFGDALAIAAHAVVELGEEDDAITESAWGDGDRFVTQGNWATHFAYAVR